MIRSFAWVRGLTDMMDAAAQPGLADAISRWQRRERDRELHSADRAVLAAREADPREATDVFLVRHESEKAAAEALVEAVQRDNSGEAPARDALLSLQQARGEAWVGADSVQGLVPGVAGSAENCRCPVPFDP